MASDYGNGISSRSPLEEIVNENIEIIDSDSLNSEELIKTQKYLSKILHDFYHEHLNYFTSFLKKEGLKPRFPQVLLISDYYMNADYYINEGGFAYTDGYLMLGSGSGLKEKILAKSKETNIPPRYIEEFVIAHELIHMAQPKNILKNEAIADAHDFVLTIKYYAYLLREGKGKEWENYRRLAALSYHGLSLIREQIKKKEKSNNTKQLIEALYKEGREFYLTHFGRDILQWDK